MECLVHGYHVIALSCHLDHPMWILSHISFQADPRTSSSSPATVTNDKNSPFWIFLRSHRSWLYPHPFVLLVSYFPVCAQLVELVHLLVSAALESQPWLSPPRLCSVLPLKSRLLGLGWHECQPSHHLIA